MIPNEIQNFIEQKITFENYCLPQFYPDANGFEQFQSGYRYNETNDENLIGEEEGKWKENWYVICSGYANDPFFVDFSEAENDYPVYFAWHGAGSWKPIMVTEILSDFLHHLIEIKKIESDKVSVLDYIKTHFDIDNELWKEIYQEYEEQELSNAQTQDDLEDWILGKIIITDVGNDKMKVINFLKSELKLTPQQALSLSKQNEIEFMEGYLKHLKYFINQLESLGAKIVFRENDKPNKL